MFCLLAVASTPVGTDLLLVTFTHSFDLFVFVFVFHWELFPVQCRREVDSNTPAHFPALPVSYAMGDICVSVHPICVSIKVQGEWCCRASWEKYANYCLLETISHPVGQALSELTM